MQLDDANEQNDYNSFALTQCGHFYHADCLAKWLETSSDPNCPACAAKMPDVLLHRPAQNAE